MASVASDAGPSLAVVIARAQQEAEQAASQVEQARHRAERFGTARLLPSSASKSDDVGTPTSTMRRQIESVPTLLSHIRHPFDQSIAWYPSVRLYSRRELLADALVHGLGLCLGAAALVATVVGALKQWLQVWRFRPQVPFYTASAITVYGMSLLAMLICSAAFNVGQRVWRLHTDTLALLDHIGICLLIAGSATPVFLLACCVRQCAVLWALMLLSIAAKAAGGVVDNIVLHVIAFVVGPLLTIVSANDEVSASLEAWQYGNIWYAGVVYVGGLFPWANRLIEYHVAIWHVCVLVASALVWVSIYSLVETPEKVESMEGRLVRCFSSQPGE